MPVGFVVDIPVDKWRKAGDNGACPVDEQRISEKLRESPCAAPGGGRRTAFTTEDGHLLGATPGTSEEPGNRPLGRVAPGGGGPPRGGRPGIRVSPLQGQASPPHSPH